MPSGACNSRDLFFPGGGPLRDFIDAILAFIGASSLTDDEYTSINQTGLSISLYNKALYTAMSTVLIGREAVSSTQDRLRYFFLSKGISDIGEVSKGKTNVYIGDPLC